MNTSTIVKGTVIAALGVGTLFGVLAWSCGTYRLPMNTHAIVQEMGGMPAKVIYNAPVGTPEEDVQAKLEQLRATYRAMGYTEDGKFGREIIVETGAGFHTKKWVQSVYQVSGKAHSWSSEPTGLNTADKSILQIVGEFPWRVEDPILFKQYCRTESQATARINEVFDSIIKEAINGSTVDDIIRRLDIGKRTSEENVVSTATIDIAQYGLDQAKVSEMYQRAFQFAPLKEGQEAIMLGIMAKGKTGIAAYGLGTVEPFLFVSINYDPSNLAAVVNRMKAEMANTAGFITSMGAGEAQRIIGEKDRDLNVIDSYATAVTKEVNGIGEAEALATYNKVLGIAPNLFTFLQSARMLGEMDVSNWSVIQDAATSPIYGILTGNSGISQEQLAVLTKELKSLNMEQLTSLRLQLKPITSVKDLGYAIPSIDTFKFQTTGQQ